MYLMKDFYTGYIKKSKHDNKNKQANKEMAKRFVEMISQKGYADEKMLKIINYYGNKN